MNTLTNKMAFWEAECGRALTTFEQMTIARPFVHNKTNNKWARVIKPVVAGKLYGFIDVDLSLACTRYGVNPGITVHSLSRGHDQQFYSSLPDEVVASLRTLLGDLEYLRWLMYGNVLGEIDAAKFCHSPHRVQGLSGFIPLNSLVNEDCQYKGFSV